MNILKQLCKYNLFLLLLILFSSCNQEQAIGNNRTGSAADAAGGEATPLAVPTDPWLTQVGEVTELTAGAGGAGSADEDDECLSVATDSAGNVYCAGTTRGDFGEAHGGGTKDAFIMKLNSDGDVQWITHFGGTTSAGGVNTGFDFCNGVTADDSGNVYCAGQTNGSMGEANSGTDAFILKLDSDGALLWMTHMGATTNAGGSNAGTDTCKGVAVDATGNVYCAGYTTGDMGETNGGSTDAFIVKLNSAGAILWLTQVGTTNERVAGASAGGDECMGVAVDSSGNVYCGGNTDGDLGEGEAVAGFASDIFVMKVSSAGALLWVSQLGDTTVSSTVGADNTGYDICNGVAVDNSGNVFCAGYTGGDLGEVGSTSNDAYIAKFNTSGALQWVTQLGGTTTAGSNTGNDRCSGVATDSDGNVFCGGTTGGALGEANGGGNDAFIMKLNSAGALQFVSQLGGATSTAGGDNSGSDSVSSVAVGTSGNIYIAGDTFHTIGEASDAGLDVFIAKFSSTGAME